MMLRVTAALMLILALSARCSAVITQEIFRIRIENRTEGCVQVSLDQGKTYTTVGHVNRPATTTYPGFPAAAYVPDGTVAATAIHGIRLKVGTCRFDNELKPNLISLVPSEFQSVPHGYGGHIPHASGIYTDIPAGTSIFRSFAPFVGNPIKLERKSALVDFPEEWRPSKSDIIVVIALLPNPYLNELEFENKPDGAVTAKYANGKEERVAIVLQPVSGIGRYDGTSYTGVGLINTNHGGVVTISTAPISGSKLLEGQGRERRGGFQILPSKHAKTQIPTTQAMVVGPVDGGQPLEGLHPIFSGYIGLAFDPANITNSIRAEVSVHGGPWEPMHQSIGKDDNYLANQGITKLRLLFPSYDQDFLTRSLDSSKVRKFASKNAVHGLILLRPTSTTRHKSLVTFAIDGQVVGIISQPPYEYIWDTTSVTNGEHTVEIKIKDALGNERETQKRCIIINN
jgi:hypothetical protein